MAKIVACKAEQKKDGLKTTLYAVLCRLAYWHWFCSIGMSFSREVCFTKRTLGWSRISTAETRTWTMKSNSSNMRSPSTKKPPCKSSRLQGYTGIKIIARNVVMDPEIFYRSFMMMQKFRCNCIQVTFKRLYVLVKDRIFITWLPCTGKLIQFENSGAIFLL